jgi:hypothetical protein
MDGDTLVSPQETDPDADVVLECPEPGCDYVAEGDRVKVKLGLHRFSAHGIRSETSGAARQRARENGTRPVGAPRGPRAPSVKTMIRQNVRLTYGFGSVLAAPLLPAAAGATRAQLDQIADAWADMSDEEWVRQLWGTTGTATKWGGLAMAHLPILASAVLDVQTRRAARAERRLEAEEAPPAPPPPFPEAAEPFYGEPGTAAA